jgi:glycerophosphoryl diester phosphodiesterase
MAKSRAGRIFISYRRQETAWPARQLYEVLTAKFGVGKVFKDVDDIKPGEDFDERIRGAVGACDVLLALIGPQWSSVTDEYGRRRLEDPDDFVRLEIETALGRDDVRVIPILVDGAQMPRPYDLPQTLLPLVKRQAIQLSPMSFDTTRLVKMVQDSLAELRTRQPPPVRRGPQSAPPAGAPMGRVPGGPGQAGGQSQAGGQAAGPPGSGAHAGYAAGRPPGRPPIGPRPPPAGRPPGAGRRSAVPLLAIGAGSLAVLVVAALLTFFVILPSTSGQGAAALRPTTGPTSANPAPTPVNTSPGPSSSPSPGVTQLSGVTPTPGGTPTPGSPSPAPTKDGPAVLAHRGGYEQYPLETLPALTSAAVGGYAIETDIRWTRDGVAVIVHDDSATKGLTCSRPVKVSKVTWKDLRKTCQSYADKKHKLKRYPITTYAAAMEALAAVPDTWVYAEVKVDQTAKQTKQFVRVIRDNGMSSHTVVTSFIPGHLATMRKAAPDLRRMLFVSNKAVPASTLKSQHLWGVAVEIHIATKSYVQQLHAAGLTVVVWIANEERAWKQAQSLGADKVLTDNPAGYTRWLAKQ